MEYEIINPDRIANERWAETISEMIRHEADWLNGFRTGNMLPQSSETVLHQLQTGMSRVARAIENPDVPVGFVTLYPYKSIAFGSESRQVNELGSLVVDTEHRGQGLGKHLVKSIVKEKSGETIIIATVKTARTRHVLETQGFGPVQYEFLSGLGSGIWEECCPCFAPAECFQDCGLRQSIGCQLMVYNAERLPGIDDFRDLREHNLIR
jgi:N-acetylglutamate synthase-like GNAT family acetyltransferase